MEDLTHQPSKPFAEAADFEEFKQLRGEVEAKRTATPAEPAGEKTPQTEEVTPVAAAERPAATRVQEPPAEKSVDDQIKELRAKGQHAKANKLEREAGAIEARKAWETDEQTLRQELEGLRARPSQPASAAPPTQPTAGDAAPLPTDEKYAGAEGWTKYVVDMATWNIRQQNSEQQAQRDKADRIRSVVGRIQAFKSAKPEHADFDAVTAGTWDQATNRGAGLYLTPSMVQFVEESEHAPAVLYHLGKNMDVHAKLVALSPAMQLATLGQLAHLISMPAANAATPEKRKPAVTRAAAPPTLLTGTDEPEPQSLAEASSYEQFKAMRKARRLK